MPMRVTTISITLALTIFFAALLPTYAQKKQKVHFVKWEASTCDEKYDANRLVTRITDLHVENGHTFLTVSFSDNCCAEFKPLRRFEKNRLYLYPYPNYFGDVCDCHCCFSIAFEFEGLEEGKFQVFFKDKKIERSDDHYPVVEPMSEKYLDKIINRRNRYGFMEGLWMTFYDDGKLQEEQLYAEHELYHEPKALWSKTYYPSGALENFHRKDTSESWFEDGQLKSQFIEYKMGDTTYEKGFQLHDNRQLERKYMERYFPAKLSGEVDPNFKNDAMIRQGIYEEEFFDNGNRKYLHGRDTSYTWFVTGKPELKEYASGSIAYDEDGFVKGKSFYWKTNGPAFWGDLNHTLYVDLDRNGIVSGIHYVRDEEENGGVTSVHYNWEWNDKGQLTEMPADWTESLPWKKFSELRTPQ
jgi:antitoxin component YwqK of YwqJK toxin-antitoxin module